MHCHIWYCLTTFHGFQILPQQNQRSIGVQAFESAAENNLHPSTNSAMPAHDMQLQINNYQTGEHSTTEDRAQKKVKGEIV